MMDEWGSYGLVEVGFEVIDPSVSPEASSIVDDVPSHLSKSALSPIKSARARTKGQFIRSRKQKRAKLEAGPGFV